MGAHEETVLEIRAVVDRLARLGEAMFVQGAIIGSDRVSGRSRDGYGDDEVVAVAVVVEISAELAASATKLLSEGDAYSAAVLLRQIIEVEYLLWLFSSDPEAAKNWLRAEEGEWWPTFSPATIRKKAAGHFSDDEYHYHCDLGGHPTPNARDLLNNHSRGGDSSWLWDELGCHLQRLWEKVERAVDRMNVRSLLSIDDSDNSYPKKNMESKQA
jgi:hypothetical protein